MALKGIKSQEQTPVVTLEQLCFAREDKTIFDHVDLTVGRGQVTAIMGPSGIGKTTLLRLISGQLWQSSGSLTVLDHDTSKLNHKAWMALRLKMGFLFQEGALFTDLNVFENVAFPLRQHTRLPESMIRDLVLLMLEAVGLRGASTLRVEQLSGGMIRRVALARAVIRGPELMLYDEPFSGQDPIVRGVLMTLIRKLNDALGLSSVVVSHDVAETSKIADYVYLLSGATVIAEGKPSELFEHESPAVHQFVHGLPDGAVSFRHPSEQLAQELQL